MAGGLGEAGVAPAAAPAAIGGGSTLLGLATEQWLTIAAGLVIGMVAHWALLLHADRPLGWRQVRIDAMMFLANGVLAAQAADAAGLSGVKLLTAAMMFGAGSTIVFSFFWSRWFAQEGGDPAGALPVPPATLAEVSRMQRGGTVVAVAEDAVQPPLALGQTAPRGRRKGIGQSLRKAHRAALTALSAEEEQLLARLDEIDPPPA